MKNENINKFTDRPLRKIVLCFIAKLVKNSPKKDFVRKTSKI